MLFFRIPPKKRIFIEHSLGMSELFLITTMRRNAI